jgi:hypothetical protein
MVATFCNQGQVSIVAVKAASHHGLPSRKEESLNSGGHCCLPQSVGYPSAKLRHGHLEHSVTARVHAMAYVHCMLVMSPTRFTFRLVGPLAPVVELHSGPTEF